MNYTSFYPTTNYTNFTNYFIAQPIREIREIRGQKKLSR